MRVVVAMGPLDGLGPVRTGAAVARAWAGLGAQCAVVPLAERGDALRASWGHLAGGPVDQRRQAVLGQAAAVLEAGTGGAFLQVDRLPAQAGWESATSRPLGDLLVEALGLLSDWYPGPAAGPGELWLHLPEDQATWFDGGAGLLSALGARCATPLDGGLAALPVEPRIDLAPALTALAGRRLVVVTSLQQSTRPLTGLRGLVSASLRELVTDPAVLLEADQRLVGLDAATRGPGRDEQGGAGALGGIGSAVLALGGRVASGVAELAERAGLASTIAAADLVVTGCDQMDFGTMGGDLVPLVTGLAQAGLRPAVCLARRTWVSARELRTVGLEEGYSLASALGVEVPLLDADQVVEACRPIARTWFW